LECLERVAPTDATVLLLGESGTGKELLASRIHERSRRRERPFIRVNCGAIPRELFESEFFGHAKGAFTGALKDRRGRFELAEGGTLLLDEIAEIPLELQPKLLRVLQEGEYERLGEERVRHADVRLIAATNRDLKGEVRAHRFREDLFFRLNVVPIEVPPLRERREDIPELARHFLRLISRQLQRPIPLLAPPEVRKLQRYDWPGNIRELRNLVERAVILSPPGELRFDLPAEPDALDRGPAASDATGEGAVLTEPMRKHRDRDNILEALKRTSGKLYGPAGAAALLHMKPTTLASRIRSLGIQRA
jgi:transcriptional regulator with GAF, ATPase, and Fis domain